MKKNMKRAKGVKKNVVRKQILHEKYKETLFGLKQIKHRMNILRSEGHQIVGMNVAKTSLSAFDTKRWICADGINTKVFGYNPPPPSIPTESELESIDQWLEELFEAN